jgi:DUF4097 and DUF4098 domain-containing protein YvlB
MFAPSSLLLSLLCLTAPLTTSFGADMVSETQKFAYPLTSDSRFQLSNQNGSVEIVGEDTNEVKIEATKKARSQSELAGIKILIEQKDKAIVVQTTRDNAAPRPKDISVEYRIFVPRHLAAVDVVLSNGSVVAKNLEAAVTLRSTNGAIEATDVLGAADLESENGSVALTQIHTASTAKLLTTNGSISLTLPASASVSLQAKTTVGRIQSDLPSNQRRRVNIVGEELQATLGAGASPIQLRTVNGAIQIQTKG